MEADRAAKVTEGQRACLEMVLLHMSSKDIGRALDISPHTVDQRLKLAMRILGAGSRVEAARALAAMEGESGYQPLIYQAPDIAPATVPSASGPAAGEARQDDLRSWQKAAWIAVIAAGTALGLAGLAIGLQALAQLTR